MPSFSVLALLAATRVAAHFPVVYPRQTNTTTAQVPSTVEQGIQTECKTCPYSLCANTAAYEYAHDMALTCWTRGDTIVETNVWYKTTDSCFVSEWDIIEGNYTRMLPSCGDIPATYTQSPGKTIYHTECNIIPEFVGEAADHTKMYQPEVDLTLTCVTNGGAEVLGNPTWYKTQSNCYVPDAQIEPVSGGLEDCGPIPFLEAKMREPDVAAGGAPTTSFAARALNDAPRRRWLYDTRVGVDAAECLAAPDSASAAEHVLRFGKYLVVQCATRSENPVDNEQIYLLTDDFCWVNDTLTDPQLVDDAIRSQRYPNCKDFVDTEG